LRMRAGCPKTHQQCRANRARVWSGH
jgi:hypothetical protein